MYYAEYKKANVAAKVGVGGQEHVEEYTEAFEETEKKTGMNVEVAPEAGRPIEEKWKVANEFGEVDAAVRIECMQPKDDANRNRVQEDEYDSGYDSEEEIEPEENREVETCPEECRLGLVEMEMKDREMKVRYDRKLIYYRRL